MSRIFTNNNFVCSFISHLRSNHNTKLEYKFLGWYFQVKTTSTLHNFLRSRRIELQNSYHSLIWFNFVSLLIYSTTFRMLENFFDMNLSCFINYSILGFLHHKISMHPRRNQCKNNLPSTYSQQIQGSLADLREFFIQNEISPLFSTTTISSPTSATTASSPIP